MSHNLATEDYIFPTGKAAPTNVSPIDLGLKELPLRSISTNLVDNKEHIYEEIIDDYDTPIAASSNIYDYLAVRQSQVEHDTNVVSNMDFVYYNGTTDKSKTVTKNEQIKSSFFKNRKNLIIFSSILFVVAVVAIIAVIMIVLATASKRI
jgi:hypothetical protein